MSDDVTGPLSDSVLGGSPAPAAVEPMPREIGSYRVVELIGEGGMGEVYKAERREPMRQTVAIKVVKLGMNSREVIGRFESERQTLALMDHPGIARVLDAGTTPAGRPYFVMDYVPGTPITVFCDENRLSIADRLKLFRLVCDAINHAHTKAVIHRDVKPSNVLAYFLDGVPAVRVIDFGIAKAIRGGPLSDQTVFTAHGQAIGTYDSMSPEQADGSPDIDTRTDVYALGVLLYELLTGAKPFDHATLRRAADAEIKRIIREVEPPRPSTRLSGLGATGTALAERRRAKPESLASQLRSELEWIPLKAMRKERGRRYASPAQLAEDVGNYLDGKPLLAGPETRAYRGRKFVRRHRAAVLATAVAALAVVGGTTFYIRSIRGEQRKTESALHEAERQRGVADRQRSEADRQTEVASAVSDFLTRRVIGGATPVRIPDKAVRDAIVKAMLDPAAAAVERDFKGKPVAQGAVRASLARSYTATGRPDLALPQAEAALALQRANLGDDAPETLQSINLVGQALVGVGRLADAEPYFREALDRARRVKGPDDQYTLSATNNLAAFYHAGRRFDDAIVLMRDAVDRGRRALGPDDRDVLQWSSNLGGILHALGRNEEADRVLSATVEPATRVFGNAHPYTLNVLGNLAAVQTELGRPEKAEAMYRGLLPRLRKMYGDGDDRTLRATVALADSLLAQRKFADAEPIYRTALAEHRRLLGDDANATVVDMVNLAKALNGQAKDDESLPLFREAMERSVRTGGYGQTTAYVATVNYAGALKDAGRGDEGVAVLRTALATARADPKLGPGDKMTLALAKVLAGLLRMTGHPADAAAVLAEYHLPPAATEPAAKAR